MELLSMKQWCSDVNDPPAEGICVCACTYALCTLRVHVYMHLIKWEIKEQNTISLRLEECGRFD